MAFEVALKLGDCCVVLLVDSQLQQFPRVGETRVQVVERYDDFLKLCPFLSESLCPLRFVPDIRLFEFPLNLGQSFRFAVVVKGTPLTHYCVPRGHRSFAKQGWFP